MKALMCGLLMAGVFALGCQKESDKGGPGARTGTDDSENVFTVKVPRADVMIEKGKERKVTVSIDRGKKFDQTVKLKFDLPKGLEVTPGDAEVKKGQTQKEFSLKVNKNAESGKHAVKVTGTPESGEPTTVSFTVSIEDPKRAD